MIEKTTIAILMGRDGIRPNVNKFLRDHGDESITEKIISRNEISSLTIGSLKVISSQFRERESFQ